MAWGKPAAAWERVVARGISPLRGRMPPGVITWVDALKMGGREGSSKPSGVTGVSLRMEPPLRSVKVSSR